MKMTVPKFVGMKSKEKITMITAYDYTQAKIADEAGVDSILVGDSLSMVMQGNNSTLPVSLEEMIYHGKIVKKGINNALLIVDMPFMSYQASLEQALVSAGRILKETLCDAVKLEGGQEFAQTVNKLVTSGIPVVGHLGLTPQSINIFGSYAVRAKTKEQAEKLIQDALSLEQAGAFAVVLEAIPLGIAREITQRLKIPTIGIGAGLHCDGQVLVFHDMLGLFDDFKPKFVKRYAHLKQDAISSIKDYIKEVKNSEFPTLEYSYE
ncbi:3-methyl-2-oxobutanoate hydroxymethyltransferase [Desulfurella amilsii]|uniref:3-methyl-2-oxobutanoate hydroxymethyltransferase n=1 Tax=Desulfurella amilsii TaxID=1562698 RepID=A0A1X4XZE3_9BACT|nr:3-methyl-2-oxobutanoate hydroxymethyltransferase [Desulfurella amilsii]OSS42912.1 3-methyl-2-oxobutanoate hydroxymethyltransferase [Desulfurella amilsii]